MNHRRSVSIELSITGVVLRECHPRDYADSRIIVHVTRLRIRCTLARSCCHFPPIRFPERSIKCVTGSSLVQIKCDRRLVPVPTALSSCSFSFGTYCVITRVGIYVQQRQRPRFGTRREEREQEISGKWVDAATRECAR